MNYQTRMRVWVFPAILVLSSLTTACSMTEEQKHAYRNAESIKPIEMPPGMKMTQSKESLAIPEQKETKLASVDELEKPPRIVEDINLDELDDEPSETKKSDKAKSEKTEIKAVSVTATRNAKGDSILLVNDVFDKVWPLVKPALLEMGFKIDDSSRGTEMYVISRKLPTLNLSDKPVHPGDEEPEVKEEFQIHVKPKGEQTQITVHNKLGQLEGSGLADHLLLQIKEIMENPKQQTGSS